MLRFLVALLLVQCITAVLAGSCVYGDADAPTHYLTAGGTRATISGVGVQVNPITNLDTGDYLASEYIRAEVLYVNEMVLASPGDDCIRALDPLAFEAPTLKSLNISKCSCAQTLGEDYFPGNIKRTFVRVDIDCDDFPGVGLTLDVSVVDAEAVVAHPNKTQPDLFTYDIYRPGHIKFNVTATGWDWSDNPDSYGALFIATTVNVPQAMLSTNTTTYNLTAHIENDHVRFIEEINRGFTFDGFSYLTEVEPTGTSPFEVAENFQIVNGIAMCYNHKPIAERPSVVTYDPTLSVVFFGDPPAPASSGQPNAKSDVKLAIKIAVPVVCVTVALVAIFAVVAYNTPVVKNFFRPFRNTDKDGALV